MWSVIQPLAGVLRKTGLGWRDISVWTIALLTCITQGSLVYQEGSLSLLYLSSRFTAQTGKNSLFEAVDVKLNPQEQTI